MEYSLSMFDAQFKPNVNVGLKVVHLNTSTIKQKQTHLFTGLTLRKERWGESIQDTHWTDNNQRSSWSPTHNLDSLLAEYFRRYPGEIERKQDFGSDNRIERDRWWDSIYYLVDNTIKANREYFNFDNLARNTIVLWGTNSFLVCDKIMLRVTLRSQ